MRSTTVHEIFRVVSRFPRFIISRKNQFPLGQCNVYYCRQEAGGVLQEAAHLPLRQPRVGGREAGNPDPLLSIPLKNQQ